MRVLVDGAGGSGDEDVEWGAGGCGGPGGEAGGGEDGFEFPGAYHGVDFGDVSLDLVAVAFDQAAGDDDALGLAAVLPLGLAHFRVGMTGPLLGGSVEGAGFVRVDLCSF